MYSLVPVLELSQWDRYIEKPKRLPQEKFLNNLKDFYAICRNEHESEIVREFVALTMQSAHYDDKLICFNAKRGRLGTYEHNIPTTLSTESTSDEIEVELEKFKEQYITFAQNRRDL